MPEPRISRRAKHDLIEIWNYIAEDSAASADALVDDSMKLFVRSRGTRI